ncbi:MAG: DUF4065 domain-containing protein [Turicibacter sp.]|nr:DUF4065 domain-containing protein [Turicibacter sp.]
MREFCVKCQKEVEYTVLKNWRQKIVKGYEVEFEKQEAICSECQHLIFVDEIHEQNSENAKKAYQKKVSHETISIINSIMSKYNIGKRPLSLLLDWGELTITRYLKGMTPKKEYLDLLKNINEDAHKFDEMLQKNQNKITKIAYEKCMNKLEQIGLKDSNSDLASSERLIDHEDLDSNHHLEDDDYVEYDHELESNYNVEPCDFLQHSSERDKNDKIFDVVDYILSLSDDITPLALQKILYYSQAFFKVFYGYHLFENNCEAWDQGPVYPEIYNKFKNYYDMSEKNVRYSLDEEEQFFIELIMRYFGCYSGKSLERMTHCEKPWRETRKGLSPSQKGGRVIQQDLIESYFTEVYKKYNMLSITDIMDYSTALFNRVL